MKIFVNILRLTLLAAVVTSFYYSSWLNLFTSTFTIVLTFLPSWFEKKYRIDIPIGFEIIIILFVYASLFLGSVTKFYDYFWWWDILLHTSSAMAFALAGFVILLVLFQTNNLSVRPVWLAVFSFAFSLALGALWEIYEFTIDQIFGTKMQTTGLVDTMWDLISDSLGAFFASAAGYLYLKGLTKGYFARLLGLFIKNNPNLFKN